MLFRYKSGDMGMGWHIETRRILTRDSYNVTPEELFDLFGKFGPIRYATSVELLDPGILILE